MEMAFSTKQEELSCVVRNLFIALNEDKRL